MLRWRSDAFKTLFTHNFGCTGIVAATTTPLCRTFSTTNVTSSRPGELNSERLKSACFRYEDQISRHPIELLNAALKAYLPHDQEGTPATLQQLRPGNQHAFFRPRLSAQDLCEDGTDIKFLPGPQDVWRYRLWAGGSVEYHSPSYWDVSQKPGASLVERTSGVRIVSKEGMPSKVFVTIERIFAVLSDTSTSKNPFMTETENICFLRDVPTSLQDERVIRPPADPKFSHTMTATRSLLFQFSALTYNAHSIHLDREYAQKSYGAKDLVVHGPLTQVLMLEFLHRTLKRATPGEKRSHLVRKFEYTNLQPLYVDQPFTLCCKPLSSDATPPSSETTSSWQVWIQKGEGAKASCAVKATAAVEYTSS